MASFIRIPSWPDGVTPPAFKISHPDTGLINVVMPSPVNMLVPEFLGPAAVKRSKYTNKIHKSYPVEGAGYEIVWVLRADEHPRTADGVPIPTLNLIDVIHLIHKTDKLIDVNEDASLQMYPHFGSGSGVYDSAVADREEFLYAIRLTEPPQIKPIGAAAWQVTLSIDIDGQLTSGGFGSTAPYPYNTHEVPVIWRDE